MKKITVRIKSSAKTYPIVIGDAVLKKLGEIIHFNKYSKVIVITDVKVEKSLLKNKPQFFPVNTDVITLPFGERTKTISCVEEIWKQFSIIGADRKSLVLNLGGGVIGDMGGFAASTYMRGIDFVQIPTTLLAMVDASIGGKVGVNFNDIKNLIGLFKQPAGVILDISTLRSLPERIFIEGFGEIIKHGIIADRRYFDFVTSKRPTKFSKTDLVSIIEGSINIKVSIIKDDEFETKGSRKLINFGHTIGHAIEVISQETENPLLHGEAISIGMVAASYISLFKKMIPADDVDRIKTALQNAGLPITVSNIKKQEVIKKIKQDKKVEKSIIKWTLITSIGNAVVDQVVEEKIVEKALAEVII